MDKQELLQEMKKKFEQTKQELGFNVTLEDLERIFYISDGVLNSDFISENFSRQLSSRIVDTYMNWNNYLHSLIMPNPQSMINMHESKMFADKRQDIINLITKAMALVSRNTKTGLTKDKKQEAEFIDDSVKFWDEIFKPSLVKILEKVVNDWKKDAGD